ncbi:MAG: rRNA maturation RNase YbeY [Bacteroidetes bacterium]|nr:rRNA maturation RNase YbeY [Bacteroidota bacterium]
MLKQDAKSRVRFFYPNNSHYLKDSSELKIFIDRLFKKEGKRLEELNYIFCSDQTLLEINKKYLNHNYYTDIITFNLSENKDIINGESYISIDRVRSNSSGLGISFRKELLRVIFHGALHLCDYKDKTTKDSIQMRIKEDFYLSLFVSR